MVQRLSQELRSEKARNVISPIPSALIRYGTASIVFVFLLFTSLAAFLPARNTLTGNAYVDRVFVLSDDSISVIAYIELPVIKDKDLRLLDHSQIDLYRMGRKVTGLIVRYKTISVNAGMAEYAFDLLFTERAVCDFTHKGSTFSIILSDTSVLRKLLNTIRIKSD